MSTTKSSAPPGRKRGAKAAPAPSPVPWIAIVAVVAIASGTMLYIVRQKQNPAPVPADSASVAPLSSSSPGAPKADGSVEVVVIASPPEAVISLDGTPVVGNPFRAQVARSSAIRKVSVSAAGYETQEKAVVFDQESTTVRVTLSHSAEGATAPKVGGGPLKTTTTPDKPGQPAVGGTPTVGDRLKTDRDPGKSSRTIDDKDPYAP